MERKYHIIRDSFSLDPDLFKFVGDGKRPTVPTACGKRVSPFSISFNPTCDDCKDYWIENIAFDDAIIS